MITSPRFIDVPHIATSDKQGGELHLSAEDYAKIKLLSNGGAKGYGVIWDGSSATKWTRIGKSAAFIDPAPFVNGVLGGEYGSPFDNIYPWCEMTVEERTGGTMVKIPKFYYKLDYAEGTNGLKIQISDEKHEGFYTSPAHMDRGDGFGEREVVYVGRYHSTLDFKSKTQSRIRVAWDTGTFTELLQDSGHIHELGPNIWLWDWPMLFTIQLLYLVEYADWNSQRVIGVGGCFIYDKELRKTGASDSMPYHTGTMAPEYMANQPGVQYRNIENLWSNAYSYIASGNRFYDMIRIDLNPENTLNDFFAGVSIGPVPNVDGFISKFAISKAAGFPMLYPIAFNGSSTTFTCDYRIAGYDHVDEKYTLVGGLDPNEGYGLFYMGLGDYYDMEKYDTGYRIMELPYSPKPDTAIATISITTAPNALIEAVHGNQTYAVVADGNGMATLNITNTGEHTISATNFQHSSDTENVNVTENASYSLALPLKITEDPDASYTFAYSGKAQTPTWESFNSSELDVSGDAAKINTGDYTTVFTPKAGYTWADGSTTSKTVNWSIERATDALHIAPSILTLTSDNLVRPITFTKTVEDEISVASSNTDVATVFISGENIIVSAVALGTATITASIAETANCAASTQSCSVAVIDSARKISSLTPAQLHEVAKIISNDASITDETTTVEIDTFGSRLVINVGDTIDIEFGNKTYKAFVMGFNHSDLADPNAYGTATATGKAGIFLQTVPTLNGTYQMNSKETNVGGWERSNLRATLQSTIKESIPEAWRNIIKQIIRKVGAGNGSLDIVTLIDDLTISTVTEMAGAGAGAWGAAPGESGPMLAYCNKYRSAIVETDIYKISGQMWLCTPSMAYPEYGYFYYCAAYDTILTKKANNYLCVAPCFCV